MKKLFLISLFSLLSSGILFANLPESNEPEILSKNCECHDRHHHNGPYLFAFNGTQVIPDNPGTDPVTTSITFGEIGAIHDFRVNDFNTSFTPRHRGTFLVTVDLTVVGQTGVLPTLQIYVNETPVGVATPLDFSFTTIQSFTAQAIVNADRHDAISARITNPSTGLGIILTSASITIVPVR